MACDHGMHNMPLIICASAYFVLFLNEIIVWN